MEQKDIKRLRWLAKVHLGVASHDGFSQEDLTRQFAEAGVKAAYELERLTAERDALAQLLSQANARLLAYETAVDNWREGWQEEIARNEQLEAERDALRAISLKILKQHEGCAPGFGLFGPDVRDELRAALANSNH